MSDHSSDDNHDEKESFADLLESYSSGMSEDIRLGDKIKGEIISIGKDRVYIDTGTKIDGFVEKSELLDDTGGFSYKIGEFLELYVVSFSGDEIALSKAISGVGGLRLLEEAAANAVPVEGKVKEHVKGGFHVEVSQRRAFCPISQMDLRYIENPEAYIGNIYRFLITRIEENGRNIVLSRRDLLEREQKEERTKFLQGIQVGDQIQGRVTKVMPYGVFVEIFPGLEGMVHISELSWSRIENAEEAVKSGESVLVTILGIKPSEKNGYPRISLSIKQVTGDPWDRIHDEFRIGDRVKGKVTRCMGFGAFVEIAPGIEGLVHISEMSYTKRILKPEEIVQIGETISVLIKEIDFGNRRITLSIKDVEGDPWNDIEKRYSVGLSVEGILEKRERFGIFVRLEPGVTGLLPQSKMKEARDLSTIEKLKPGDPLKVIISEIHSEQRKMTLIPAEMKEEDDWRRFSAPKENSLGSLGEKFKQALKNKK